MSGNGNEFVISVDAFLFCRPSLKRTMIAKLLCFYCFYREKERDARLEASVS